jgi:hypothetical protein
MADGGTKPLSSAKVKPGARMTARRQRRSLCEIDHIHAGDPAWERPGERIDCTRVIRAAPRGLREAQDIPVIDNATSRLIVAIIDDAASG